MTVYRPKGCKTWRFDFEWDGRRHLGTTKQIRKEDALIVEGQIRLKLRQQAMGIAPFDPKETPRFQDWAKIYLKYQTRYVTRPDVVKRAIDVVLEFFGAKPTIAKKTAAVPRAVRVAAPYHDLRLGDVIARAQWILDFEHWIDQRGVSGSTRNTYLSTLSGFYRVALEPQHRDVANVPSNPFAHIRRSPPRRRIVALEKAEILHWIDCAYYHVGLAATIAALAPKMRLRTILDLEWAKHFDREFTRCTVHDHKTAVRTGEPQVTPISVQLRDILLFAKARSRSRFVITYGDEPVHDIKMGAKRAAQRAGLTWGHAHGVTFHTIRHSIATLLAEMGMSEAFRKALLGHKEIRTTQQYTHLTALSQMAPHEALSAALPLQALMEAKSDSMRRSGSVAGLASGVARKAQKTP